jgi:hypothetical protein
MMDAMQGKPKPTNTMPGMIYMLCGATQRSNTDPPDKTSPGDSHRTALDDHVAFRCCSKQPSDHGSRQRRLGESAGTPYPYLHICGTPWEGTEYHEGDKAVWTMSYAPR